MDIHLNIKILFFILTTNRQLVIYGIKKPNKCEFCHV